MWAQPVCKLVHCAKLWNHEPAFRLATSSYIYHANLLIMTIAIITNEQSPHLYSEHEVSSSSRPSPPALFRPSRFATLSYWPIGYRGDIIVVFPFMGLAYSGILFPRAVKGLDL